MQDIKFRARRAFDGKWVYGDLIQSKPNKVDGEYSSWIKEKTIMPFGAISTPTEKFIKVRPETVGQFTGITDKNGKDGFEEDIARYEFDDENSGVFVIRFDVDKFKFSLFDKDGFWGINNKDVEKRLTIIGNTYENPELLE